MSGTKVTKIKRERRGSRTQVAGSWTHDAEALPPPDRDAEQRLRASEERYRTLASVSSQAVWSVDGQGHALGDGSPVWPTWQQFTGMSDEQVAGLGWWQAIHPDDRAGLAEVRDRARKSGSTFETEYRLRRYDGEYRLVTSRGLPILDATGGIREWVGTCTDITDRVAAERRVRDSEERYRSLVKATTQMVWTVGPDGRSTGELPDWNVFTGQTVEARRGRGWRAAVHPDDLAALDSAWKAALASNEIFEVEYRIRRHDGVYRLFAVRGVPVLEADGSVREWVGTFTDITEQREAERRLRESEERFRTLVVASAPIMWSVTPEGRTHIEMPTWREFTGMSIEKTEGHGWMRAVHRDDRAHVEATFQLAMEKKAPYTLVYRIRRSDGVYRLFSARCVPVLEPDGSVREWVGTATDITERDESERLLRLSERRYRSLVDATAQIVWVLNAEGRSTGELPHHHRFTGLGREGVLGYGWLEAAHPEDRAAVLAQARESAISKERYTNEYRLRRHDGEYRLMLNRAVPVFEDDGSLREWIGTLTDITEHRDAERQLRCSEERYRSLVEATSQIVWVLDPSGRSTGELPSYHDFTGLGLERVSGFGWLDAVHPEDRAAVLAVSHEAGRAKERHSSEYRIRRHDGEYRLVHSRAVPVLEEDGSVREWIGTLTDITEQRAVEEERKRLVQDLGQRVKELTTLQMSASILQNDALDAACVLGEIVVLLPYAFQHPELAAARIQIGDLIAATPDFRESPWRLDATLELRSGRRGTVEVCYLEPKEGVVVGFLDEERHVLAALAEMLGSHFDRRAAEESLYLTQFAVDHSAAAAFLVKADGRLAYANTAAGRLVGLAGLELVGRDVLDFRPGARKEDWGAFWDDLQGRRKLDVSFEVVRVDGTSVPVEVFVDLVEHGGVEYGCGVALDLTARREAEQERRLALQTVRRLGQIVEDAEDAIIGADLEGSVTSWNQGAERMYGYAPAEVLGQSLLMLVPDDRLEEVRGTLERARQGERVVQLETRRLCRDGSATDVSLSVSPIRDEEGEIVGLSSIDRDITKRKELEEQLRQSQKMEAIGHLAGGVAHDFNNLLTVINGYGDLLGARLRHDGDAASMVQEIRKAGANAAALTSQLLAFSRRQVLKPVALDLNVLVSDLERMLVRLIGEDIELITVLDPALGQVKADPGQLEQVLLNLVVNARDALEGGGCINIETSVVHVETPPKRWGGGSFAAGMYAMLAVRDTGCGMDAVTRDRIFEPFFTTKEPGKGTGLGLATVYGIVEQSGGFIEVETELAKGTEFRIFLPRTAGEVATSRTEVGTSARGGNEVILLVEDDEHVRRLLGLILRTAGYQVLEAEHGEHALQMVEEAQTIDLLITDVVMPRMGGSQLASALKKQMPELRVLFLSGYSEEAIERQGSLGSGGSFLQKPCSSAALTRKVRELLDADGRTPS